tara:strand:+ start:141 stop:287 length:147 start_codon:yes stop_codon:yes gene_type:complete
VVLKKIIHLTFVLHLGLFDELNDDLEIQMVSKRNRFNKTKAMAGLIYK